MARLRGNRMAMIFQEPMTSLNPAFTVGSQMTEVLTRHKGGSRAAALDRAVELLGRVGITAPEMRLGQFPHQLSGGLRQRVMIAMALMCDPELLIADEPTTALDVTVQAQILRLLATLKRELGLAILLITHDLGIVARVADRVSVMYAGEVVERAPTAELFRAPQHPYTRGLLSCVPVPGQVQRDQPLGSIPGMVPAIAPGFAGCAFRSRCRMRTRPARTRSRAGRPAPRTTISAGSRRECRGAAARMSAAIEVQNLRCEFRVACRLADGGKARDRGRRRHLQRAGRQRARHRRRIRLRQVHAGAPDPRAADADGGHRAGRRQAPVRPRPQGARPADPAGVPGSVRLAQSAPAHQGHRRAAADGAGHVLARRDRAPGRAEFSNASGSRPRWASACRRNSPAGSASARRSRARWCWSRGS